MPVRTYPLRLTEAEAAALQHAARIQGLTMAQELRTAVSAHLEHLRHDVTFQKRLHESIARDRELYESLGALENY